MSEQKTLQQLIDGVVNSAHDLARVAEDFDGKCYREGATNANLKDAVFGLTNTQINAKLKPRIKAQWTAHQAALAALKTELVKIDDTINGA